MKSAPAKLTRPSSSMAGSANRPVPTVTYCPGANHALTRHRMASFNEGVKRVGWRGEHQYTVWWLTWRAPIVTDLELAVMDDEASESAF
jgi:hypothetical protein